MENVSAVRKVRKGNGQASRCAGNTRKQAQISPDWSSANGFLKQQFLPLFEQGTELPNKQEAEKDFFESLAVLKDRHRMNGIQTQDKPYPYNLLLAYHYAQQELSKSEQDNELLIMQDEDRAVKLISRAIYNTGTTLYYIPVIPLYRLLQDKKQKKTAELLLSVFAYLYHIAGIPYYRDDYSALAYEYECIEEWFDEIEEDDENDRTDLHQQLRKASYYGDMMFRKIYNLHHLNHFGQRIESFSSNDTFSRRCLEIAKKAYRLLQEYPNESIFRNTANEQLDDYDGLIRAPQYISFIADNEGLLYEHIAQAVNDQFNECCEMEQPTLLRMYDKQNNPSETGLDFEYKIFPFINDLCTLLNQIP